MQSDTRNWLKVLTKHKGLILVNADPKLFSKQMYLVIAVVASVASDKNFKVIVANFRSTAIELCPDRLSPRHTLPTSRNCISHMETWTVSYPTSIRMPSSESVT